MHRYVQAHCRLGFYRGGRTPAYDAVSALWFKDQGAMQQAFSHELLVDAPAIEATIMNQSGIAFLPVQEHTVL